MNANEQLITQFYEAFQKKDPAVMIACYGPDVRFSDPVFTDLRGAKAGAMWTMLIEGGSDLRVEFRDVSADDRTGRAHWDAWYTFSATGRPVHNSIDASFEFSDGKITRHTDSFNLPKWAAQALGPMGRLFGRLPFLQKKIRAMAAKRLDAYVASRGRGAA
jgi:ketosteroid isomerase-like protein